MSELLKNENKTMIILFLLNLLLIQGIPAQEEEEFGPASQNWTNCTEFLKYTKFDPRSVLDIDWKIFYLWSMISDYSHHVRFRIPPPALLARYKDLMRLYKNPPYIDWSDAVLFYESSQDFSGLLIQTNTSGLFKVIPANNFDAPPNFNSTMYFALKLVDNVLGLMNCNKKICYALAPLDKFPKHDELTSAAAKLNFRSDLGRSYLAGSVPVKEEPSTVHKYGYYEDGDEDYEDDFVDPAHVSPENE